MSIIVKLLLPLLLTMTIFSCSSSNKNTGEFKQGILQTRSQSLGGKDNRSFEEKTAEQGEILKRQEMEINRQNREIEDLKRQQYHNDNLRRFE